MAALAVAAGGCSAECAGPGCAQSYGAGRLSWLTGIPELVEADVWDDAVGAWSAGASQGTDWRVRTALGRLLTGQPDADRVIASSARATQAPLNALSTWSGEAGTGFGRDLLALPAASGFDLWVSAPDAGFGKGQVHLFRETSWDGQTHDLDLTLVGGSPNDHLGSRLFACGDVVGADGLSEILVSAPFFAQPDREVPWEGGVPNLAGAVFLVRSYELDGRIGSAFPWEVGASWFGVGRGAGLGAAVSCDADLDGDGRIDVLLGAPWEDGGRGRLYVLSGAGLPPDGRLVGVPYLSGEADDEWFGAAVTAIDVGRQRMIAVGSTGAEGGTGRVRLFPADEVLAAAAKTDGPVAAAWVTEFTSPSGGDSPGTHFGHELATGDFDGDGRSDLVVGSPDAQGPDNNDFDTGALDLWLGPRRTWRDLEDTPDARVLGTDPFQRIGRSFAVDDLDGDGLDDLVVATRTRLRER